MSKTPRTDNHFRTTAGSFDYWERAKEFARTLERELNQVRAVLADPAAVWANMLRGEIARPGALDHYEACKQRVETLERENAELRHALSSIERFGHDEGRGCGYLCADMAKKALDTASGPA